MKTYPNSIPKKPAVKSLNSRKLKPGFWVKVGWVDAPAQWVIWLGYDWLGYHRILYLNSRGLPSYCSVDSPEQIIEIGKPTTIFANWPIP